MKYQGTGASKTGCLNSLWSEKKTKMRGTGPCVQLNQRGGVITETVTTGREKGFRGRRENELILRDLKHSRHVQ